MTIVAQLISGPAAVLTTGLLIMPIAQIVGKNSGWEAGLGVLIIGAGISAFTLPAGIYWGGRMTGGNGSFWWTTTGCILGGTLMALPNIMGLSDDGTGYIRITLGIFIGGIAGYHFSSSAVMSDRTASTTILRHDVDLSIQKWKRTLPQPTVSLTILTLPL